MAGTEPNPSRKAHAEQYALAIAFVCACVNKECHQLTIGDFSLARTLALRRNGGDVARTLHRLIEFPGLREMHCRHREDAMAPIQEIGPAGTRV